MTARRPVRRAGWLAWGGAAVTLALIAAGFALHVSFVHAWIIPIAVSFALVGALIGSQRPENPIGWLFLGFGAVAALDFAAYQYARHTLVADPGSLPGADVAAAVAVHVWHAGWGLFVFAFLLFPRGRLLSPRWRWVARATVVTYGGLLVSGPFDSSFLENEGGPSVRGAEPLVDGVAAEIGSAVFGVLLLVNLVLLVVAGASLLLRLRRSTGEQRQQVKWFVYTVVLVTVAFPVILLGLDEAYGILLFPLMPASAAVAILKHRLYDIDVVVNRTLVYGALTVALGGAYVAGVLFLQLVLQPLTSESNVAIAGSTLAVAALFGPARARIQSAVDRRFFRRRYDAARTAEAFGAWIAREVALDAVSARLCAVADETLQPSHAALWLRDRDVARNASWTPQP